MRKIIVSLILAIMFSFASFAGTEEVEEIVNAEYKNTLEFETAGYTYDFDDVTVLCFKNPVKITAHYNDSYRTKRNGTVTIDSIGVNEDGVPVLSCTVKDTIRAEIVDTGILVRYYMEDGSYTDIDTGLAASSNGKTWSTSHILFGSLDFESDFKKKNITSIEVWIHEKAYR